MSTQLSSTPGKKPIDSMVYNLDTLASLTPDERSAIYLNSIRKMLMFFVVLAAVAIIAGVVLGILDISAVHSLQQPLGFGA